MSAARRQRDGASERVLCRRRQRRPAQLLTQLPIHLSRSAGRVPDSEAA